VVYADTECEHEGEISANLIILRDSNYLNRVACNIF
jgi:hypothetical protein